MADLNNTPRPFSQWAPVKTLFFIAAGYLWEEHRGKLLAWAAAVVCVALALAVAMGADLHFPLG